MKDNTKQAVAKEPFVRIAARKDDFCKPLTAVAIRVAALVGALLVCGLFIRLAANISVFEAFAAMLKGTFGQFGNATSMKIKCWDSAIYAARLLCISVALAPAFKMRFWNIGAEGQICIGAIAASFFAYSFDWPSWLLLTVMAVAGFIVGGLWGLIPAIFKTKFGTNETLFTLMMNYIAAYFIQYLREGPWRDPAKNGFPEMPRFAAAARLPSVLGVHAGWIFALAIALFVLIYLRYTKHGYELTVVGDNITTARYAGMPVNRIILRTMFISAGVCGLSGMIQASGANKMLTDSVAGGDGFTAIIVAWLARLSPVGILIVAVMFGVLKKGCASVETVYKISSEFFGILQGIILFFVLGVEFFITYRVQRKKEVK